MALSAAWFMSSMAGGDYQKTVLTFYFLPWLLTMESISSAKTETRHAGGFAENVFSKGQKIIFIDEKNEYQDSR